MCEPGLRMKLDLLPVKGKENKSNSGCKKLFLLRVFSVH